MYAAIVPNSPGLSRDLAGVITTVDEVELRTGLGFFSALDDAKNYRSNPTFAPSEFWILNSEFWIPGPRKTLAFMNPRGGCLREG